MNSAYASIRKVNVLSFSAYAWICKVNVLWFALVYISFCKAISSFFSIDSDGDDAGGEESCRRPDPRPPVLGGEDIPGTYCHHPQPGEWGKDSQGEWESSPHCLSPHASHHLYAHFQGDNYVINFLNFTNRFLLLLLEYKNL